jgi:hypothetical protein
MWADFRRIAWRYVSGDRTLRGHGCENLKSLYVDFCFHVCHGNLTMDEFSTKYKGNLVQFLLTQELVQAQLEY